MIRVPYPRACVPLEFGGKMPTNENNIPTDSKTFAVATPSDIPSVIADIEVESPYAQDDEAKPIDDLIKAMAPQRKVLMGILAFCKDRARVVDTYKEVDRLQEFAPSVYTGADFCELLEEAGGIERVTAEGSSYDTTRMEPSIVEEDGTRYYVANEPDDMYWGTLPAGITILNDDNPIGRAQGFFEADPALLPLYKRVLLLCDANGDANGCSLGDLSEAIDGDPLVQSPRVYAPFFVDRLEQCDAIEWKNMWYLTDVGREVLSLLDDVS
jgi:hypothetical protein